MGSSADARRVGGGLGGWWVCGFVDGLVGELVCGWVCGLVDRLTDRLFI